MFDRAKKLEYEFLPAALEIIETPPVPLGRLVIWIISTLIITFLLWSYFGRIDEVASSRGKVIPDGRLKEIQSFEEAKITAIHVKEGQKVKAGELLLELDLGLKQTELNSLEDQLETALYEREVLLSDLGLGKSIGQKDATNSRVGELTVSDLIVLQNQVKQARSADFEAKKEELIASISQKNTDIEIAKKNVNTLKEKKKFLEKEIETLDRLVREDSVPRYELQKKQQEILQVNKEIEAQELLIVRAENAKSEAEKHLKSLETEWIHNTMEEKKQIANSLLEKEKQIQLLRDQIEKVKKSIELQKLTSPVSGTVHGLSSYTIGGVVKPAQPVVTIVPDGTPLIVESTVLNKDIGFIKLGQKVEVKFDTFPFQKYGTIEGEVTYISPDAVEHDELGPVYKIKVNLSRDYFEIENRKVTITPGMAVTAEVKTGQRRIIEFFLSPIVKYAKESLTLR
jgi:hemolysin D